MIFTLISLVVLGVVLRGLYFFSAGGTTSPGAAAELLEEELSALPTHSSSCPQTSPWKPSTHLCRLRGMGLRLYLSETTTALAFFFTGTRDGVSSSSPGKETRMGLNSHPPSWLFLSGHLALYNLPPSLPSFTIQLFYHKALSRPTALPVERNLA